MTNDFHQHRNYFQCTLLTTIIPQIPDIFHSKTAFGGDDNWLQDADVSLVLQLSQFHKHPRLKGSRKALPIRSIKLESDHVDQLFPSTEGKKGKQKHVSYSLWNYVPVLISGTTVGSQRLVIYINQEEGERGRTNSHPGGAGENHRNWTVVVHCGITKVLWDTQATLGCKEWQRQIEPGESTQKRAR